MVEVGDDINVEGVVKFVEEDCKTILIETKDGTPIWISPKDIKTHRPTVTQSHGKWKREEFPNFTSWFCDKCGRGWRHKFNCCPNCGDKKEGEDDE